MKFFSRIQSTEKESRISRHISSERLAATYRWSLIHVYTGIYIYIYIAQIIIM